MQGALLCNVWHARYNFRIFLRLHWGSSWQKKRKKRAEAGRSNSDEQQRPYIVDGRLGAVYGRQLYRTVIRKDGRGSEKR